MCSAMMMVRFPGASVVADRIVSVSCPEAILSI